MNNKHLLKTRLNSLAHYDREIERLNAAKQETEKTKSELLQSLREFLPWKPGQIIFKPGKHTDLIFRLVSFKRMYRGLDGIQAEWTVETPTHSGGWDRETTKYFSFEDMDDWKIIYEPETASNVQQ